MFHHPEELASFPEQEGRKASREVGGRVGDSTTGTQAQLLDLRSIGALNWLGKKMMKKLEN